MKALSEALVKFQTQMKPVTKDSENPFFKSSYADLSSILQTIVPVLSACGIAVVQPMRIDGEKTILVTRLVHSSGEIMESEMILPHHADPQKYGSLITYYKRYQLQAMLGVSTSEDDNDGNNLGPAPQTNRQAPPATNQGTISPLASAAQIGLINRIMPEVNTNGMTKQKASELIQAHNNKPKN
jgi:hypothetical protein